MPNGIQRMLQLMDLEQNRPQAPPVSFDNPPQATVIPPEEDEGSFIQRRMKDLYTPETRMSDELNSMLTNVPQRNKPGMLRKIVATLAAAGSAPNDAERVAYAPYYRNLQDWNTKLEPVMKGAEIERNNNTNLRMIANSIISNELGERRLNETVNRNRVLEDQGNARIEQGNQRIEQGNARILQAESRLAIAKELAKGGSFQTDDAGNAFIVYRDGSKKPVDAQYLTFEEKEELRALTAGARAAAVAANQRDRIVERVIEDPSAPGRSMRVRINLETGDVEPLTMATPEGTVNPRIPQTPQATSRETLNRAQQIKNSNPAWSKWIKVTNGQIEITRPPVFGAGYFGPTKEQYDEMSKAIFGQAGFNPNSRSAVPPANGRVRVIGPNGERGTVSAEEAASLPTGWRKE